MVEKLEESIQLLAKSERENAWRDMAKQVAHEIKNPLTSLRLAAELLCTLLKDQPDLAKRAEVILREATRLENIVRNMLQKTKKLDLHYQEVDLNKLAKEVVEGASYQIKARGQQVSLKLAPGKLVAQVDPEKIKQVIWNLLTNASDVTPRGGLIEVKTRDEGDQVMVVIEDQGPGVPEDRIKELFKPFYTTKPGGTGLGLAISRQIVLIHGGELRLENRDGKGARAVLILPRFRPQVGSGDLGRRPEPGPPEADTLR
jgi:signal transduction histidine kinase